MKLNILVIFCSLIQLLYAYYYDKYKTLNGPNSNMTAIRFAEANVELSFKNTKTDLTSERKAYNYKLTIYIIKETDTAQNKPAKVIATLNFDKKTINLLKKKKVVKQISYLDFRYWDGFVLFTNPDDLTKVKSQVYLDILNKLQPKLNAFIESVGQDQFRKSCSFAMKKKLNTPGNYKGQKANTVVIFCFKPDETESIIKRFEAEFINSITHALENSDDLMTLQKYQTNQPLQLQFYDSDIDVKGSNAQLPILYTTFTLEGLTMTKEKTSDVIHTVYSFRWDQMINCRGMKSSVVKESMENQYQSLFRSEECCVAYNVDWNLKPMQNVFCSVESNHCKMDIKIFESTIYFFCLQANLERLRNNLDQYNYDFTDVQFSFTERSQMIESLIEIQSHNLTKFFNEESKMHAFLLRENQYNASVHLYELLEKLENEANSNITTINPYSSITDSFTSKKDASFKSEQSHFAQINKTYQTSDWEKLNQGFNHTQEWEREESEMWDKMINKLNGAQDQNQFKNLTLEQQWKKNEEWIKKKQQELANSQKKNEEWIKQKIQEWANSHKKNEEWVKQKLQEWANSQKKNEEWANSQKKNEEWVKQKKEEWANSQEKNEEWERSWNYSQSTKQFRSDDFDDEAGYIQSTKFKGMTVFDTMNKMVNKYLKEFKNLKVYKNETRQFQKKIFSITQSEERRKENHLLKVARIITQELKSQLKGMKLSAKITKILSHLITFDVKIFDEFIKNKVQVPLSMIDRFVNTSGSDAVRQLKKYLYSNTISTSHFHYQEKKSNHTEQVHVIKISQSNETKFTIEEKHSLSIDDQSAWKDDEDFNNLIPIIHLPGKNITIIPPNKTLNIPPEISIINKTEEGELNITSSETESEEAQEEIVHEGTDIQSENNTGIITIEDSTNIRNLYKCTNAEIMEGKIKFIGPNKNIPVNCKKKKIIDYDKTGEIKISIDG